MLKQIRAAATAALATAGLAIGTAAIATPVTYYVSGSWATNSGTHNLNGGAPFGGGGSYDGFFTIDDTTFTITDYDLTSQLVGRFTTFNGSYDFGAPQNSVQSSTATGVSFYWYDAPAAGNQYRLIFTLDSGSSWGDTNVDFSSVFTDVDTPFWVGTGIIASSGPGVASTTPPAVVPVPPALPLLLAGVGVLAFLRRKKADQG